MRISNGRTFPAVTCGLIGVIVTLTLMTPDERYVAAPGFACVIIVLWLCMSLWDSDQQIPFFDIGIICAAATLIYTIYPLLNYWSDGLQFGSSADFRLSLFCISPAELGFFHLRHVLYLTFFVVSYSSFRGKGTPGCGNVGGLDRHAAHVIIFCLLVLTGYFYVLNLMTGVTYDFGYEEESFTHHVDSLTHMPLLLLQISHKLHGLLFVFKLSLLMVVFNKLKSKKWQCVLFLWIVAEIVQCVMIKGARTDLVLFLGGIALLYHRMIKPFNAKALLALGSIVFFLFIFMGLYRSYYSLGDMQSSLSRSDAPVLSATNEFQSLLGTSYSVLRMRETGVTFPWYLYLNDFITILPPQQILPFRKVAAPDWYLEEIGLSGSGIGLMWGVISQSIVGLDWFELAFRGLLLGYILARLHRWYLKRKSGFMETFIYMFFCLRVYYTFRDTTFSPLADLVWAIIPFYLILFMWGRIRSRKVRDVAHNVPCDDSPYYKLT